MLYKMVLCMCVVAATAFQAPASKLGMSAVRATAAPATRFASAVVMDEVEDKVKGIIAEQLGVEAGSVKPDSSFTEDLGADSLDAVELIMAIEEAFDHDYDVAQSFRSHLIPKAVLWFTGQALDEEVETLELMAEMESTLEADN